MVKPANRSIWIPKALLRPGVILVVLTALSLIISNSSAGQRYIDFWHLRYGFTSGKIHLFLPLTEWINDGLMTVFFLLVGLEIRRELMFGQLSSVKKAALPFFAAAGGMIVPALVYVLFNYNSHQLKGWGVPMATDIAFALAVLSIIGKKISERIKVFLTALAIIDDLGAVLIIAVFYTSTISLSYLAIVTAMTIVLLTLNKTGVRNPLTFILAGIILWYAMLKSGVHATVAGVVTAFCIPVNRDAEKSMLHSLEHFLAPVSSYFILPLFVLANTALVINSSVLNADWKLAAGIITGLVIGKPLGITLFSYLGVRLRLAEFTKGLNLQTIAGAGMLGGIGFTMAIFISMLAFDDQLIQDRAKIAVFTASIIAALTAFFYLRYAERNRKIIAEQ